jgi:hypothetical protein
MPRFYLHICDGAGFAEDEEGLELPDEAAARKAAIAGARDIMAADVKRGELDLASFVEVEDDNHGWLFTISFGEALALRKPAQSVVRRGRSQSTDQ